MRNSSIINACPRLFFLKVTDMVIRICWDFSVPPCHTLQKYRLYISCLTSPAYIWNIRIRTPSYLICLVCDRSLLHIVFCQYAYSSIGFSRHFYFWEVNSVPLSDLIVNHRVESATENFFCSFYIITFLFQEIDKHCPCIVMTSFETKVNWASKIRIHLVPTHEKNTWMRMWFPASTLGHFTQDANIAT